VTGFRWVQGADALAAAGARWAALTAANPRAMPFANLEWNRLWQETAAGHVAMTPALLMLEDDQGTITGLLPLAQKPAGPFKRLEWFGREVSDFPDLMLAPGVAPASVSAPLLAGLARAPGHYLDLDYVLRDSCLAQALPPAWLTGPSQPVAYIDLTQGAAGIEAGLSSRLKRVLRTKPRKITEEGGEFQYEIAQTAEARTRIVDFLTAIKPATLKSDHDRQVYQAAQAPFLRKIFARADDPLGLTLHVACLNQGGTILAAHAGFITRNEFWYYQPAFNPQMSTHSPGAVLIDHLLKDALARGLTTFNFLRGGDHYKVEWTQSFFDCVRILRPIGLVGHVAMAARALQHRLRGGN